MTREDNILFEKALARVFTKRGVGYPVEGFTVMYAEKKGLREDEYQIRADKKRLELFAGGVSGLYAGAGAWMRKCGFDGKGGFVPFCGELSFLPKNPIHGMYFASHFHNYYEDAPIGELSAYIEDLAFRGCNALMAWYDMHHFKNVDEPDSMRMVEHLKKVFTHASAVGMKTVFGTLANEAFDSSPEELRAEWTVQNGYISRPIGHYHVELCPNKEGGLEEILRERRAVMDAFEGTPIDYISIWPYDQGGCTCKKCAPWGANGYLKTFGALSELYREILPDAKILLSTWYFDRFVPGEWAAFNEKINAGDYGNVDCLFGYFANEEAIPSFIRAGKMPGGKPMIAFPEISMYGATPWGGFGANPMPERMQKNFNNNGGLYSGALPYSEGIFEDVNKALILSFYAGKSDSADDIIREYAKFEFCLDERKAEDFVTLCHILEETLVRRARTGENEVISMDVPPTVRYHNRRFVIEKPERVREAAELAASIDRAMPEKLKKGIRWQMILLRTKIDLELAEHDMFLTEKQKEYAAELVKLYHGDNAGPYVTPLTVEGLLRFAVE